MASPRASTCTSVNVNFVEYVIPPAGSVAVFDSASQNWIFPIPGTGYGLSFWNLDQKVGSIGNVNNYLNRYTGSIGQSGVIIIKVTLWKIPGVQNSGNAINISDFQVIQAVQLVNPADNFSPTLPNNGPNLLPRSFTTNTIAVSGNLIPATGTCLFSDKIVQMGTHDNYTDGATSQWKDASFTVACPEAWGYNRTGTLNGSNVVTARTQTSILNQNLNISVLPRTAVVDNTKGIIAFSNGAVGFGLQLAWGTVASQSTGTAPPLNPVIFNSPTSKATAAFGRGTKNNIKIDMAARYIRTSPTARGGPANAAVEIVANYN